MLWSLLVDQSQTKFSKAYCCSSFKWNNVRNRLQGEFWPHRIVNFPVWSLTGDQSKDDVEDLIMLLWDLLCSATQCSAVQSVLTGGQIDRPDLTCDDTDLTSLQFRILPLPVSTGIEQYQHENYIFIIFFSSSVAWFTVPSQLLQWTTHIVSSEIIKKKSFLEKRFL